MAWPRVSSAPDRSSRIASVICDEILALGHALHAVDAKPGEIVPGLGDQRVAVRRLQIAERRQRLLQGKRQAREPAGEGREHAQAPGGQRSGSAGASRGALRQFAPGVDDRRIDVLRPA